MIEDPLPVQHDVHVAEVLRVPHFEPERLVPRVADFGR
jgi:hypothetical protein